MQEPSSRAEALKHRFIEEFSTGYYFQRRLEELITAIEEEINIDKENNLLDLQY